MLPPVRAQLTKALDLIKEQEAEARKNVKIKVPIGTTDSFKGKLAQLQNEGQQRGGGGGGVGVQGEKSGRKVGASSSSSLYGHVYNQPVPVKPNFVDYEEKIQDAKQATIRLANTYVHGFLRNLNEEIGKEKRLAKLAKHNTNYRRGLTDFVNLEKRLRRK